VAATERYTDNTEVTRLVTRDTPWPDGTPCWVDLSTADIPKAISFYSSQFGWDIQQGGPEVGGYSMARLDGRNVAGIGPNMTQPDAPSAWALYIASSDADATAGKIVSAGGKVLMGPMDVMDVGRMLVATDTTGATFGVWQARKHTGAEVANVPGAFTWSEHMSHDFEGAKAFYAAVFGYEFGDMSSEGFSYATLLIGGQQVVGGIGAFPGQDPDHHPFWSVYFGTTDTDKAVEVVTSHGGAVVMQPTDSPYGRMAIVTDNQGAVFSLISTPADE
jgi:predicted enzyme related to lactoylglutathione lyase